MVFKELDGPCEAWAVIRHHVTRCTLTKIDESDIRDALTEVPMPSSMWIAYFFSRGLTVCISQCITQYDQLRGKNRTLKSQISGLENDVRAASRQTVEGIDQSVDQ